MEFHILDKNFSSVDIVENYNSAIWTERYYFTGDFVLVLTDAQMAKTGGLVEGGFVKEVGSIHVGIINKIVRKDGMATVTGEFLEGFLRKRAGRKISGGSTRISGSVEWLMAAYMWFYLGEFSASLGVPNADKEELTNLNTGLEGGSIYPTTPNISVDVDGTPNMYDLLVKFAEPNEVGWRLYPVSTGDDYTLFFRPYRGLDRTVGQTVRPSVILSEALDTLSNTERVVTTEDYYTNVCVSCSSLDPTEYGLAANYLVVQKTAPGTGYYIDFDRKTKFIIYDDLSPDDYNWWTSSSENGMLNAKTILTDRANDFIANQTIKQMVSGEIMNSFATKYGSEYFMGDIITLESAGGYKTDVRIVEYVRSEDETGNKAYPTVMTRS